MSFSFPFSLVAFSFALSLSFFFSLCFPGFAPPSSTLGGGGTSASSASSPGDAGAAGAATLDAASGDTMAGCAGCASCAGCTGCAATVAKAAVSSLPGATGAAAAVAGTPLAASANALAASWAALSFLRSAFASARSFCKRVSSARASRRRPATFAIVPWSLSFSFTSSLQNSDASPHFPLNSSFSRCSAWYARPSSAMRSSRISCPSSRFSVRSALHFRIRASPPGSF
mmetsp:Transcript_75052/g.160815  ORF Transcript_75052/g.160815 Transcript_75052/m.160815 type:complete len:229 (+) Transcript_75052:183-869(+)